MSRYIKLWSQLVLAGALACGCAAQGQLPGGPAVQAQRDRLQTAEAMFQAHCKSAGEKIYKTVDHVDGIFLMRIRPEGINYHDQFAMTDPYGDDSGGETYIKTFFSGFYRSPGRLGYQYVDAIDPKDGKRYRYTGATKAVGTMDASAPNVQLALKKNPKFDLNIYTFVVDRVQAAGPMPRYGVTYDDISTHEDREYWIAGSSLKVIDLQTNEVIAERIGYMIDRGQGNTSGGRSPWLLAAYHACPAFPADPGRHPVQTDQTRNFVTKILKP